MPGWFLLTVATLPVIIGGCVVVSEGEEGAGPASAVGQAAAVPAVAGAGLEHTSGGPRGRGVPAAGNNWSTRLQNLPAGPGDRVRARAGPAGDAADQRQVPVPGRAGRDRGPAARRAEHPADRRPARPGPVDDLAGSCAATRIGWLPAVRGAPPGYRTPGPHRRRRIENNGELRQLVAELLAQRWSPQQISRHLRLLFPDDPAMWLCHESIYQAVYQPGSVLMRPSPLAPHRRSPLRGPGASS